MTAPLGHVLGNHISEKRGELGRAPRVVQALQGASSLWRRRGPPSGAGGGMAPFCRLQTSLHVAFGIMLPSVCFHIGTSLREYGKILFLSGEGGQVSGEAEWWGGSGLAGAMTQRNKTCPGAKICRPSQWGPRAIHLGSREPPSKCRFVIKMYFMGHSVSRKVEALNLKTKLADVSCL